MNIRPIPALVWQIHGWTGEVATDTVSKSLIRQQSDIEPHRIQRRELPGLPALRAGGAAGAVFVQFAT